MNQRHIGKPQSWWCSKRLQSQWWSYRKIKYEHPFLSLPSIMSEWGRNERRRHERERWDFFILFMFLINQWEGPYVIKFNIWDIKIDFASVDSQFVKETSTFSFLFERNVRHEHGMLLGRLSTFLEIVFHIRDLFAQKLCNSKTAFGNKCCRVGFKTQLLQE